MFAVIAEPPRNFADLLLADGNCLLKQSCGDHRGERHHDGWGIGWYENGQPQVVRSPGKASEDRLFRQTAERVRSTAIVAHVRQASVGALTIENCHPFAWDRWLFAHNGTIQGFEQVRPRMEAEMSPHWLGRRKGTTDSELLFLWLMNRGEQSGIEWSGPVVEVHRLIDIVRQGIRDVARWSAEAPPAADGEPTRLNLLLTDGRTLLATRWQYDLHYCQRERKVMVSSEPIGAGPWRELPEGSILSCGVDQPLSIVEE